MKIAEFNRAIKRTFLHTVFTRPIAEVKFFLSYLFMLFNFFRSRRCRANMENESMYRNELNSLDSRII